MADVWDPDVYLRFQEARARPFHDLLALVPAVPGGRVVDLGCGPGELTAVLHGRTGAAETLGVDSSPVMLARADEHAGDGLRFEHGDLTALAADGSWDVVFANASLQWVPDHPALLAHLAGALAPGGTLAVQVPANFHHPSHVVAGEVGESMGLPPLDRGEDVLAPGRYAEVLHDLGLVEIEVVLRVYGLPMAATADVVAWVEGTLLTWYRGQLDDDAYATFHAEYVRRLLHALGDPDGTAPYYFAFDRILFRARRPAPRP